MTQLAVDTSVAVPLILAYHDHHVEVTEWWAGRNGALCGQALVETYSVVTRMPPPLRLTPADAARLLADRFAAPLVLATRTARRAPEILADRNIAGSAAYDALVALTALEHGHVLATRDNRARATYETIGVDVLAVG